MAQPLFFEQLYQLNATPPKTTRLANLTLLLGKLIASYTTSITSQIWRFADFA